MLHAEGPLCSIDLTERTVETEDIDDVLSSFIGGRGVGTKLAFDRVPFDADPLGPENRLYFTTGPMQASRMSYTGRTNATALSPLTDGLVSSNAGGFVSRNLAGTGYGAIEFKGRSDEPIAIHITDQGVEFDPVPDLAGALVSEVTEYVESRDLTEENAVAIGPAGENLVRFASIMTTESRAFGRGGLGAVLGSKNVKAITFDGDSHPEIEIPDVQNDVHREAATTDHIMKRQGTTSVTDLANEVNGLPTRYFSEQRFEGAEGINGDRVEEKKFKKGTCSACAFACKLPTRDEERGVETEGPEFETVMAFGSNCAIDDIVDVMQSNELCDEFGLDTISCGNTIAGYLASEDAFGDAQLIHDTVERIAHREGVGDTLAEGISRAHEDLGVENWTVKHLSFAGHEGRTLHGQGLAYAVANRGADHMYSTFYAWEYPLVGKDDAFPQGGFEGKPEAVVTQENTRALEDCGIVCRFSRGIMNPERYENLFSADYEDLLDVGARVIGMERQFNNERGFDRGDDTLPYVDQLEGFDDALSEYYAVRGWNDDGTVAGVSADD
ncbi:aldehyde ferredoxin oxidoreductase family protein [Halalkalicoccus jeotgali]|uniref:Aldehyde:ferredoxin oxidoreductase n=1 Tax=Halalkalicoccus jeotgali (strain DSM 18796 / CECT 7217 / JCM 14584 / KCTC 4019 / B3) TaxID=795797 RepID=D8J8N0_HALJB|nr:aldehyde ferredoxin oxidoreductase C-terminal domain-containing protein [Halalkalicoccus jeotgali]ADJ14215.1 aldehyde:ferredoxin oxidoreductase [Halalkalicoccus jeotgali B3]ELY34603.1 aldehyde:ferredoxin oxidoreductase [Halalkalicoccus jeotgali B3]